MVKDHFVHLLLVVRLTQLHLLDNLVQLLLKLLYRNILKPDLMLYIFISFYEIFVSVHQAFLFAP